MSAPATTPDEIGPNEDASALRIQWRDGHVSIFAPRYLRLHCPCAGCVDELTGERTLTEDQVPADVHPLEVRLVGRYAVGFDWSDGHHTGIYPFDYLRKLCPCPTCL